MAAPPCFLFSHNSAASVKMLPQWLSTICPPPFLLLLLLHHYHHYHYHHLPSAHRHPPTPLTPAHARRPCSWTRSTSAQRNSFSNFPWLRKQYTCLNNVDISNALKRSSNGALIGSKWIQDYKHREGAASLYCGLSDLHWTDILDWRKHEIKPEQKLDLIEKTAS